MDNLDKEWTDLLNNLFRASGLNEVVCKVSSVLYIQPEEISMEDLTKETGYSLSSISNTMKILVNAGLVKRIRKPKTKKVFFYMEKDITKLNKQKFKFACELIGKIRVSLPKLIEKYKDKAMDKKSKKKLRIMKDYYKQVTQFEEMLNHMLEELDKVSTKS